MHFFAPIFMQITSKIPRSLVPQFLVVLYLVALQPFHILPGPCQRGSRLETKMQRERPGQVHLQNTYLSPHQSLE